MGHQFGFHQQDQVLAAGSHVEGGGGTEAAPLGNKRVSERGGTRVPAPATAYSAQNRSQRLNNLSGLFSQCCKFWNEGHTY